MEKIQVNTGTPTRPAPTWRRRLPGTGGSLLLLGLVGLIFSAGAPVLAASQSLPLEKGPNAVQQALKTSVTDIPPLDQSQPQRVETFTFGLGWFWGIEARFGVLKGVVRSRVGYAGGTKAHPTYRSLGDHTETVEVDYDPTQISYKELLDLFWASHNPGSTAWSRQYMNVIFYHNDDQKRLAEESKAKVAAQTGILVQTAILPATPFTLAEDYHQKYYLKMTPAVLRELSRYYPNSGDLVGSRAAARLNGYVAGYGSPTQLQEELPDMGLSPETGRQLLAALTAKAGHSQGCPIPK